jgi:hypothetical protein
LFQRLSRRLSEYNLIIKKAEAGSTPFGITNNTQQELRPITSLTKSNYKLSECLCALARQNQRSNWFLAALFFVSFFWASKEKK